jgi:hypothetical protein
MGSVPLPILRRSAIVLMYEVLWPDSTLLPVILLAASSEKLHQQIHEIILRAL